MTQNLSADLERDTGQGARDRNGTRQGARDAGRNEMGGRGGEASAEPRQQRVANGEWFFLEDSAPALPKKFSA